MLPSQAGTERAGRRQHSCGTHLPVGPLCQLQHRGPDRGVLCQRGPHWLPCRPLQLQAAPSHCERPPRKGPAPCGTQPPPVAKLSTRLPTWQLPGVMARCQSEPAPTTPGMHAHQKHRSGLGAGTVPCAGPHRVRMNSCHSGKEEQVPQAKLGTFLIACILRTGHVTFDTCATCQQLVASACFARSTFLHHGLSQRSARLQLTQVQVSCGLENNGHSVRCSLLTALVPEEGVRAVQDDVSCLQGQVLQTAATAT